MRATAISALPTELIPVKEAKKHWPLLDEKQFIGAMYHPLEGHLDPAGTTHAYAKAARVQGAEVIRKNRVTDTVQRKDGAGMWSPSKARFRPTMSSTRGDCGRARSDVSSAWNCPSSRWRISI